MKPNRCRGFTFIEILIALTLLAIVAVPLLQMFAVAVEQVTYADDLRTALDLAREEVEKVKNLALTESQLKALGNAISPPIRLNQRVWYAVRVMDPAASA
jgi:prepilin-type N-terminal cleavage/methylation domain-containing protein